MNPVNPNNQPQPTSLVRESNQPSERPNPTGADDFKKFLEDPRGNSEGLNKYKEILERALKKGAGAQDLGIQGKRELEKEKGEKKPDSFEGLLQGSANLVKATELKAAAATQASQSNRAASEVAELANKLIERMNVSQVKGVQEVTMRFGPENPKLKGVEVTMTQAINKAGELPRLEIRFNCTDPIAAQYIQQNQSTLETQLKELRTNTQIHIDIRDQSADTGGQDRESKGEYIPEESEEEL